jgi:hypothetical protein
MRPMSQAQKDKCLLHRVRIDTSGLSEMRSGDYQLLVDRWMKTVGKLPDKT